MALSRSFPRGTGSGSRPNTARKPVRSKAGQGKECEITGWNAQTGYASVNGLRIYMAVDGQRPQEDAQLVGPPTRPAAVEVNNLPTPVGRVPTRRITVAASPVEPLKSDGGKELRELGGDPLERCDLLHPIWIDGGDGHARRTLLRGWIYQTLFRRLVAELRSASERLAPLLAHDRAGLGWDSIFTAGSARRRHARSGRPPREPCPVKPSVAPAVHDLCEVLPRATDTAPALTTRRR